MPKDLSYTDDNFPAGTSYAKATDTSLFKYCGMWQATDKSHPTAMLSYWNVAYVEIDFTGGAITLHFSSPTNFVYSIDGGAYSEPQTNKMQADIRTADTRKHTLRVRNYAPPGKGTGRSAHLYFAGVSVPTSASLSRTPDRAHYIQFVGDSISDGSQTFAYRVGEKLGWDFSVTSCEAMGIRRNHGWWFVNNGYKNGEYTEGSMARLILDNFGVSTMGMEDAFFKLGLAENVMTGEERALYAEHYLDEEGTLECSFTSGNSPDIVFIFLGTNDQLTTETNFENFVNAYADFVARILQTYGDDTQICIMNALTHSVPPEQNDEGNGRYVGIREAALAITKRFPSNIQFIDREKIIPWNVEIGSDNVHPTKNGQDTLTEKISEFLMDIYG